MAKIWEVDHKDIDIYPVLSDTPTLMLCGEFDHGCPPKYAHKLAAGLTNSHVKVFKGLTHTQVTLTPCLASMMYELISNPTKALNSSCVQNYSIAFSMPE